MNIWEQSFDDLRRPYLEEGKRDNDLANNYPPYDKVTRGDIIAGAKGNDEMGGKNKEAVSKNKRTEKKEHSDWRSDLGFFTEEDCGCDGPMKPKKGIKNKVTINPEIKVNEDLSQARKNVGASKCWTKKKVGNPPTKMKGGKEVPNCVPEELEIEEEKKKGLWDNIHARREAGLPRKKPGEKGYPKTLNIEQQIQEKPGDGYIGNTPIPNPIRLAQDAVDAYNRKQQQTVDAVNKVLPGSASMNASYFNKGPSDASKRYLGLQNSYEPEGEQLDEVTPPGDKYERMVKHIKKGYSDGGLSKKEKSIAYATAWKQYNKAKNEEFAGNYEGPLYAPHPDLVEKKDNTYLELDMNKRQKNNEKALADMRNTKADKDMVKAARKHFEEIENELDYYLDEALRPASERMKRVQTAAGRKNQEQQRTIKSKLEAEADKILAGLSKKGTGTAKTKAAPKPEAPEANRKLKTGQKKDTLAIKAGKAMSEQEDKNRKGTDYKGRDYGGGHDDKPTVKIPLSGVMQGGWMDKEKKKKK